VITGSILIAFGAEQLAANKKLMVVRANSFFMMMVFQIYSETRKVAGRATFLY